MLPSEELRQLVSAKLGADLNQYAWKDDLKNFVFSIPTDMDYETYVSSLKEVYENGYNIGHCGLTSRYLVRSMPTANLIYGTFPALSGTKNSLQGNHAWVIMDNYLIDTSLMITIPLDIAADLGYIAKTPISHFSATLLSEYDVFSLEYERKKADEISYIKSIKKIAD